MHVTVNANIRYQVIDRRLRDPDAINHWSDLADACGQASHEWLGEYLVPSKRTIGYDIQRMRSGALGYHAPIEYDHQMGYYYTNRQFSIFNVPLSSALLDEVKESIMMLQQLTQNTNLLSLRQSLSVLEEKLNLRIDHLRKPLIYLENSLNDAGQKWLDEVYRYTKNKLTMSIQYIPFDQAAVYHILSPAFIKEFNNRWYIFGYEHQLKIIVNLGLDRIFSIKPSLQPFYLPESFNHDDWFENLYGVTKPSDGSPPVMIIFETSKSLAFYMDTKPIHPSQQKLHESSQGTKYGICVYDNYEIRSKLRSFGDDLVIISPDSW